MSEQKRPFMEELSEWVKKEVFYPLGDCWNGEGFSVSEELKERLSEVEAEVLQKLKEKILESYRNGQAAGPQRSASNARPKAGERGGRKWRS